MRLLLDALERSIAAEFNSKRFIQFYWTYARLYSINNLKSTSCVRWWKLCTISSMYFVNFTIERLKNVKCFEHLTCHARKWVQLKFNSLLCVVLKYISTALSVSIEFEVFSHKIDVCNLLTELIILHYALCNKQKNCFTYPINKNWNLISFLSKMLFTSWIKCFARALSIFIRLLFQDSISRTPICFESSNSFIAWGSILINFYWKQIKLISWHHSFIVTIVSHFKCCSRKNCVPPSHY